MKAEVSQPQSSQKLVPLLRRVFWQANQTRTFLFLRAANERQQIIVKGSRVNASTFCQECDNALAQIDVAQRNRRFRNTAALTHRNQPAISHPLVLLLKCGLTWSVLLVIPASLAVSLRPSQRQDSRDEPHEPPPARTRKILCPAIADS
jgi:hypothetical protein